MAMANNTFKFGMIGLGVMGRNLLLNMADHGFAVAGFDLDAQKTAALESSATSGTTVKGFNTLAEMVQALEKPRRMMMLVPAGKPVDDVIQSLLPLLEKGDIIIDGGNSHYTDTLRRVKFMEEKGFHFMGVGISGGEQGARTGPSIMPGGDPAAYPLTHNASQLMAVAQEEGVATPATIEVPTPKDIPALASRFGLPLVLKADGTTGGTGVRILTEIHGTENIWRSLRASISPARLLKRMFVDSDWSMVLPFLRGDIRTVSAQAFISGTEANTVVACWQGEVVACVCLEVVNTWYTRGPSSVVRVVDNPAMVAAARKMVKRLNLSGFCGFDFILEEHTRTPLMIEMNARPTQLCHLQFGPGRDLITAWASAATDSSMRARPAITDKDLIAVFPHELHRDPSSPMLTTAYHDVPWSEPTLVMSCMRKPTTWGAWRPRLQGKISRVDLRRG